MGIWAVPPVAGLIEPAVAPEFYIEGVGAVEMIGSNLRVYLYARQRHLEADGGADQSVVVLKIVRPLANLPNAIAKMMECLQTPDLVPEPTQPTVRGKPHLVT